MTDIIDTVVGRPSDPALRVVLRRIVREYELALEKVAAHHAEPSTFPLPSGAGTVEQVLFRRFEALPKELRSAAATDVARRINAPEAFRQSRFGDLAGVNLRKPMTIEEQVQALPETAAPKLTRASLLAEAAAVGIVPAKPAASAAAAPTTTKLELRIHKVRCVDETNGFLGSEAGSDEIDLGGTTVDESGDTAKVNPFRVRSFQHDGDEHVYTPPRRFTFFNLTEGKTFPKGYVVVLMLAEIDSGGFNDFVKGLMDQVRKKVITELKKKGLEAGASGDVVTAVIALAAAWVVGEIFDLISNIWKDDVFPPVSVRTTIPSLSARWPGGRTDSPERAVRFRGHGGEYTVTYDWRLVA